MNDDDDFIRDIDPTIATHHELTGWEHVIFQLEDDDTEEVKL